MQDFLEWTGFIGIKHLDSSDTNFYSNISIYYLDQKVNFSCHTHQDTCRFNKPSLLSKLHHNYFGCSSEIKRYSYPRSAAIRIDYTPCRGSLITHHVRVPWKPHMATFGEEDTTLNPPYPNSGSHPRIGPPSGLTTIRVSIRLRPGHLSTSSRVSDRVQKCRSTKLLGLPVLLSRHAGQYVQYLIHS